jgi:hypothetical protein
MAIKRIPLVGTISDRSASAGKDQRFKNCFPEFLTMANPSETSKKSVEQAWVIKRPGLTEDATTAVAAGRGLYSWNGNLWAVVGNKVYKDGSAIGGTLNTSSGRVYMDSAADGTGLLIINDGGDLYTVNTSDTLATLADGDIPAATVAGAVVLDQYLFVMDSDGVIYNSDVGDVTAWTATSFLTAELMADTANRIARHVNYIVAFSEKSVEFFYDAGNTTGSPLSVLQGTPTLVGCAAGESVVNIGDELLWVAQDQGGGLYVVRMKSFSPDRVSTHVIEESLDAEAASISSVYAYHLRTMGHSFYVLTLPTTEAKTWVYDLDNGMWHEWSSYDGMAETYFTGYDAINHAGIDKILDEDNGKVFDFDPGTYQDDTNTIKVLGQTKRWDNETNLTKFMYRLEVVGDQDTTDGADLSISYSDDDYANFSTARTVDLNDPRPHLTRLGHFERRAFKYTFENNLPMRLQFFEVNVRNGHYGF